ESAMITAATTKGGAKKMSTVLPRARPTRAQAITRNRVIGFMLVAPPARTSRWRASLPLDAARSVHPSRASLSLPPFRLGHATRATLPKRRSIFDRAHHVTPGWRPTQSPQSGLPPASWQPPKSFPGIWEYGQYPVLDTLGGRQTGRPCCSALLSPQMTPQSPVISPRRRRIAGRVSKALSGNNRAIWGISLRRDSVVPLAVE